MSFPTNTSASDVWSLKSLYVAIAGDNWPTLAYGDPNFNRVSLLLNGNGPDGGQNNTYTDSSTNSFTVTPTGTIEQGSVSPFGDNWSNYLDGPANNTYLRTSGGATFSGDLTAECWVNCDYVDPTAAVIFDFRGGSANSNPSVFASSSGELGMYINSTSYLSGVNILNDGQWHHVALVRSSGVYTLYVEGVSTTTASIATSFTATRFQIGADDDGSANAFYGGYISNLRIVSGTALYTSAFTPPTAPLTAISGTELLTCQSNYFVDNSTNALAFTIAGTPEVTPFSPFLTDTSITLAANGGSAYFDGTSSYLSIADDPSLEVGSNDFTLECWLYNTGSSYNNAGIAGKWDVAAGLRSYAFYFNTSSRLAFAISSSGAFQSGNVITSTIAASSLLNEWNHIRACKSGTTTYLFLNGISVGSTTVDSTVFNGTQNFYVGKINTDLIEGYVSNVRLVNGTALSTSNFTPPTSPLTAITNTSLLLNFADAAIFDYTALNNLGTIGNADISTAVFKYGTGSLAFDGTSDYLETPNKPELVLAGAPWTVECWVRPDGNYSNYNAIFAKRLSGSTTTSYEGFLNITTGTVSFYNGTIYSSSTTLTSDVWSHCAWVYDGTNINIYVNGVSVLSTAVTISEVDTAFVIGGLRGYSEWFYGYIDDFRITKGLARYTSTFTPPTAALPTKGLPLPPIPPITTVDYLIVAGGGGGGELFGGGGAGGLLSGTAELTPSTEYTITVGAGGAGAAAVSRAEGSNGSNSSAFTLTTIGGGWGGTDQNGNAGGSGGGGGGWAGVAYTGGAGTSGQGFAGGTGGGGYDGAGGAGGGASEVGDAASFRQAGNGGDGIEWPTGSGTYYAGGGGGTCWQGSVSGVGTNGVGGLGGGGDGGGSTTALNGVGESGTANTGGGGGSGVRNSNTPYAGGAGGSGVVILRTLSTASATTGSPTETTDGSYNVYTFTGSGSITF